MPRPKIHDTANERYADYRKRATAERNTLNKLGLQAQGQIPLDELAAALKNDHWYRVKIALERREIPQSATLFYIMSGTELSRLQHDLRVFHEEKNISPKYGTYAFADNGELNTNIPGMAAIAYDGLTITDTNLLDGFEPHSSYSVSEGAVRLLLSQRKRSNTASLVKSS